MIQWTCPGCSYVAEVADSGQILCPACETYGFDFDNAAEDTRLSIVVEPGDTTVYFDDDCEPCNDEQNAEFAERFPLLAMADDDMGFTHGG